MSPPQILPGYRVCLVVVHGSSVAHGCTSWSNSGCWGLIISNKTWQNIVLKGGDPKMWGLSWSCNIAAFYPLLSPSLSAAVKVPCATERLTKRTEPFHALAGLWHAHLFLRKMLSYWLNYLLKIFDVFTTSLSVKNWYCSPSSAHPCWFFWKQQCASVLHLLWSLCGSHLFEWWCHRSEGEGRSAEGT